MPFTGMFEVVKAEPLLQRFSETGDEYNKLQMVYWNLIKRSVLEQIRDKSGRYFDSSCPDVYSAYTVALAIDFYAVIDYTMTISGASASSNTIRYRIGEIQKHINEFDDFKFTPIAPSSWQLYAIMTDSMIRAFINSNREDMLKYIDIPRVFARTIVFEPRRGIEHVKKFVGAMRYLDRNIPLAIIRLIGNIVGKLALNLMRPLRKHSNKPDVCAQQYANVESIADAVEIQINWLFKNCPLCLEETKETER